MSAAWNPGNTLEGRIAADEEWPFGRVGANPRPDGCWAVIKLGKLWAQRGRPAFCSRRALMPDNLFCGQHDHLNVLIGVSDVDDFLMRALRRAESRGEALRVLRGEASV